MVRATTSTMKSSQAAEDGLLCPDWITHIRTHEQSRHRPLLSGASKMLSHLTSDRWVAAALTGLLCLTVMGCGNDDYRGRAYDSASRQLPESVGEAVACVTRAAPRMLADPSTPSLQEKLSDCAGTTILNQDGDWEYVLGGIS